MATRPSLSTVWARILAAQGQSFETKTGKEFTYQIQGNSFVPSRTDYSIGMKDFGRVLEKVPLEGPGLIADEVRGSAYLWAVMHDPRIRENDW